jgi:hypothetical protein
VVAEKAGVTLGAVLQYRKRHAALEAGASSGTFHDGGRLADHATRSWSTGEGVVSPYNGSLSEMSTPSLRHPMPRGEDRGSLLSDSCAPCVSHRRAARLPRSGIPHCDISATSTCFMRNFRYYSRPPTTQDVP